MPTVKHYYKEEHSEDKIPETLTLVLSIDKNEAVTYAWQSTSMIMPDQDDIWTAEVFTDSFTKYVHNRERLHDDMAHDAFRMYDQLDNHIQIIERYHKLYRLTHVEMYVKKYLIEMSIFMRLVLQQMSLYKYLNLVDSDRGAAIPDVRLVEFAKKRDKLLDLINTPYLITHVAFGMLSEEHIFNPVLTNNDTFFQYNRE